MSIGRLVPARLDLHWPGFAASVTFYYAGRRRPLRFPGARPPAAYDEIPTPLSDFTTPSNVLAWVRHTKRAGPFMNSVMYFTSRFHIKICEHP